VKTPRTMYRFCRHEHDNQARYDNCLMGLQYFKNQSDYFVLVVSSSQLRVGKLRIQVNERDLLRIQLLLRRTVMRWHQGRVSIGQEAMLDVLRLG
jgi:hypothetical protein